MPRGLDHIVHAVRNLDAAADLYRRLGFTVGARNRHPWGTHNHVVQFPGFFIEVLTVAEPESSATTDFQKCSAISIAASFRNMKASRCCFWKVTMLSLTSTPLKSQGLLRRR